ncbi:MAG: SAM-dependent methyltransferase [Clostridia bacterium]|nr:SAM-dependent methyltransferase [Clostridia bacterium]
MVKLTERLKCVAELINPCDSFIDIGTDHAYLPAYLVSQNIIKHAIAGDIAPNPLKNAKKTVKREGLEDVVELRLSDGFDEIGPDEGTEIAIAGLGGLMIAEMLNKTEWLRDEKYHLVIQPMTHFEDVRFALNNNGFTVEKEMAVAEGRRLYLVLSARYCGKVEKRPLHWYYIGSLHESDRLTDRQFAERVKKSLYKKYKGTDDEITLEILRSIENGKGK